MPASRSTTHQQLPPPCTARSKPTPHSVVANYCSTSDGDDRDCCSYPCVSVVANTDYTDIKKLQSRQIKRHVEVTVKLVVLTQRNVHDAMQLFDVGDVHDEIDVTEKSSVRVHRAH